MGAESTPDRQIIIALVNAVEGREDEFNDWYTNTHLPEVVALPGFVSAQRYAVPDAVTGQSQYRHATVYEIEGSALEATTLLYGSGIGMSPAIDIAQMVFSPFVPLDSPIRG